MRAFVKEYMRTYNTCMWNKSKCHKPYELLKQLPIPLQPWESISIDFIEQLPELQGYTEILVIMDRLTKQAIFTPTWRSIDADGDQREFDHKTKVITNKSKIISKMFHNCALKSRHWRDDQISKRA